MSKPERFTNATGSPAKPVFGIPDPKWGELVVACVVLKPGNVLTADELVAYCRAEPRAHHGTLVLYLPYPLESG